MKLTTSTAGAVMVGTVGTIIVVSLVAADRISGPSFVAAWGLVLGASLAVYFGPRLKEVSLRDARIVLEKLEDATKRAEAAEARLAKMYGDTSDIPHKPFSLQDRGEEIGHRGGGIASTTSLINYVTGCITRERQRLARIFVEQKTPKELATAILDTSLDVRVFQWKSASATIDTVPKSATEIAAEIKAQEEAGQQANKM